MAKLTLNSVINPLTSKYNVKNGALLDPKFIPIIQDLCDELTVLSTHLQLKANKTPIINAVLSLAEKNTRKLFINAARYPEST